MRGDRLKSYRENLGLSQRELAAMLGLGEKQIWRYENGSNAPSSDVLVQLSKSLGVTSDYLLGLTDDPSGHYEEGELSAMERKLIYALRAGLMWEALDTFTDMSKPKSDQQDDTPAD